MKTLAAGITCKWLVSLDWIIESARAGYFLPEIGYADDLILYHDNTMIIVTPRDIFERSLRFA